MAAITPIVQNLFRLYGHTISRSQAVQVISRFPSTAGQDAIAFHLHQLGVNTIKLYIGSDEIAALNHPFLVLHSNPDGTTEALHYHKGTIHQLHSTLQPVPALPDWMNSSQQTAILAFDGEALQKASIPAKAGRNHTPTIQLTGAMLVLTALLTGWVIRMLTMPLYQWIPAGASLLVAFVSFILILKEIGLADAYTRPFCGKANYLGCSLLITSPLATNKWGISWAAAGLAHAATLPAFIIITGPSAQQLLLFTILWQTIAVITAVFLLYKMWKLRTFCKLCILVHSINLISFATAAIVFFPAPKQYIAPLHLQQLLVFAGIALFTGWLVFTIYHLLRTQKKLTAASERSTDLSHGLLQQDAAADELILQQLLNNYQPLPLYAASPDDERHPLLVVVSLHCTHCARLLQQLGAEQLQDQWKISLLLAVDNDTPAAGTSALLNRLQVAEDNPASRIQLLQQWYNTPDTSGMDEAAIHLHPYPFCISIHHVPLEQLPGIFIAEKKLPSPLGAESLDIALFTRLQQLEAEE